MLIITPCEKHQKEEKREVLEKCPKCQTNEKKEEKAQMTIYKEQLRGVPKWLLRYWMQSLTLYDCDFIKLPRKMIQKELDRNRSV